MSIQDQIAEKTGTKASDWEMVTGSPYGVSVEYWFMEKNGQREAYVVMVSGNATIRVI